MEPSSHISTGSASTSTPPAWSKRAASCCRPPFFRVPSCRMCWLSEITVVPVRDNPSQRAALSVAFLEHRNVKCVESVWYWNNCRHEPEERSIDISAFLDMNEQRRLRECVRYQISDAGRDDTRPADTRLAQPDSN